MVPEYPRRDLDYVRTHLMRCEGKEEVYYFMVADSNGGQLLHHCVFDSFFVDISDEVKMMLAMDLALDCYNTYGEWPCELPPEYWLRNFNP